MARSLKFANEHPAKHIAVFIRDSEKPGSIDARIETRDMRPYQFFSSFSNTGNEHTGHTRLSLGFQHSNLFERDHIMTLSYTTSPGHFSDVQQYGGHYRLPIYSKGAGLAMFYTHSEVDQGTVGDFFEVSGRGSFAGVSLDYTFFPLADYSHKIDLGIQDRLFKNDVSFSGIPIGVDVRSRPLSIRYTVRWEKAKVSGGFYLEYARNLGGGGNNDYESYIATRAGANRLWDVFRFGADLDHALPQNFQLRARLAWQKADEPLISGEQFGLGGVNSIRGFEEREVSGDSGQQLNVEIWSPPLGYNMRILGFADIGRRHLDEPIAGQASRESLAGIGLGLRWQWKRNIRLSFDAAYVTNGATTTSSGDEKLHFNLFFLF